MSNLENKLHDQCDLAHYVVPYIYVSLMSSGCGPVGWEFRGSNPVIGQNLNWTFTVNWIEKTKIKEKRARDWPI